MPAALKKKTEERFRYRSRSIHKRYCNDVTPLHDVTTENKASREGRGKATSRVRRLALSMLPSCLFDGCFWKQISQIYHKGTTALAEMLDSIGLRGIALLIIYHKAWMKNSLEISRRLPTIQGFIAHFGGEND